MAIFLCPVPECQPPSLNPPNRILEDPSLENVSCPREESCRGHRFEPGSGKVPHAAEQLGPCATAAEPVLWSPRATTTEPTCCNY
ncbi:hypothetical protein J1605_018549 [Eschrichtius robustus]|uniref:Uncharacterized protein n=1 Tax=Eschrichtius robustus TaxID=9764 RepID=A0AB34HV82_ESCRO|nr:hypothetical protein J1605_018549 [Eschrichtius robustus]